MDKRLSEQGDFVALTNSKKEILKIVYNGLRSYIENYGYSPTMQELYQIVGMNNKRVDPALQLLQKMRLIQKRPRQWRSMSILHRYCDCGKEITPVNMVILTRSNGKEYVRNTCDQCYRDYWSNYRSNNRLYFRRATRRWKQNRRKCGNISA